MLLVTPTVLSGQLSISGDVTVTATDGYDDPLNQAVRGDDPFNEVRMRLFAQHWVSDRVGVFTEVLLDVGADARMNGAYVLLRQLGDVEGLDARVGLAPSPLGNFGMRSTYFNQNPLLGVPLVWQYKTALDPGGRANAQELLARRDANERGLPVLYDACWPIYAELSLTRGPFDARLAWTSGAVSNALMSLRVPGWQALGRVGFQPRLGLRLGLSGAYGPYIGERAAPALVASPAVADPDQHDQLVLGYDLELVQGRVQIFSEGYANRWEAANISESLEARSAYLEARFDATAQVYLAGRIDAMDFSEIDAGTGPESWDDDLWRWEAAVGYRVAREVLLRAGWQHWRFTTGSDPDHDVLALQLSAVF